MIEDTKISRANLDWYAQRVDLAITHNDDGTCNIFDNITRWYSHESVSLNTAWRVVMDCVYSTLNAR